jgi:hypothetical protein
MKELTAGIMVALATIAALISGAPINVGAIVPLATISVWETLGILSHVIPPVVGALLTIIVWLHRRLAQIEQDQNELDKSVFGNDKDALNEGVILEVRRMNDRLDELQSCVEEIRRENKELRDELKRR